MKQNEVNAGPSIGVVAISYNEEIDLPGFLENLIPWVHEIIIVDDGSTDGTKQIALNAGEKVKFVEAPRGENEFFSHQRNKGIAASTSDWLLHMDIDERVPNTLVAEILNSIKETQYCAYRFRRLNYFLHRPMKGGGWQDWNQIHLALREVLRFEGMFHEAVKINDLKNRSIGQLQNKMIHLNDASFYERMKKSATYLDEVVNGVRQSNRKIGFFRIGWSFTKEFMKKYFFKMGFRDGVPGLISAIHSATAVFRANAAIWEEQNKIDRSEIESSISQGKMMSGDNIN